MSDCRPHLLCDPCRLRKYCAENILCAVNVKLRALHEKASPPVMYSRTTAPFTGSYWCSHSNPRMPGHFLKIKSQDFVLLTKGSWLFYYGQTSEDFWPVLSFVLHRLARDLTAAVCNHGPATHASSCSTLSAAEFVAERSKKSRNSKRPFMFCFPRSRLVKVEKARYWFWAV